jgi:hypothetical protein
MTDISNVAHFPRRRRPRPPTTTSPPIGYTLAVGRADGSASAVAFAVPAAEPIPLRPNGDAEAPPTPTAQRLKLISAGFSPLPLYGKEPPIYGKNNSTKGLANWTNLGSVTLEMVEMWGKTWPDATGTGVLAKDTPAIDLDILIEPAAEAAEALVRERYEELGYFLVRIGLAPKRLIPFRTDEPFKSIEVKLLPPDAKPGDEPVKIIELLANGRQYACFGPHPITQKPYSWHPAEPGQIKREDLPYIREAEAQKLVDDIVEMLIRDFGYRRKEPNIEASGAAEPQAAPRTYATGPRLTANGSGNAYAQAALDREAAALAQAPPTTRNDALNIAAVKCFGFVKTGYLNEGEVAYALTRACDQNGLINDDGIQSVRATLQSAFKAAQERHPPPPQSRPESREPPSPQPRAADASLGFIWHGDPVNDQAGSWLVDDMLPKTGVVLISGQWGTYKSLIALDLAIAAILKGLFAGRMVTQQGGVMWLAAEGQSHIHVRLKGVILDKVANAAQGDGAKPIDPERIPFVWRKSCPPLAKDGTRAELHTIIAAAIKEMQERFGLPLPAVIIDSVTSAGDFKDADNTSEAARVMTMLAAIAAEFEILIVLIDHFGKNVEVGTRNAIAKEDLADGVLAILATRDLAGNVTNPRLAIRKAKDAPTGVVIPLKVREVVTGQNILGKDITTYVIDWGTAVAPGQDAKEGKADPWTKSLRLLRQVMINLWEGGTSLRPTADSPIIRAIDRELVRAEYYKCYLADGDDKKSQQAAKRQAFNRAVREAQAKSLIGVREIDTVTYLWLGAIPQRTADDDDSEP